MKEPTRPSGDQAQTRREVLERRARRLARTQDDGERDEEILADLAIVRVADRDVGLPTSAVREILPRPEITPLPTADSRLAGLAQVRGRILAVAELSALLGDAVGARGSSSGFSGDSSMAGQLALVDTAAGPLGLLVDDVAGFRRLRRSELTEEFRLAEGGSPIQGITRDLTLILDVDQLLPSVGGPSPHRGGEAA